MKEDEGREKDTKEAFTEDGWFKTGDIGVVRHGGIFHIVDRKKEIIKVKGEGYYASPRDWWTDSSRRIPSRPS